MAKINILVDTDIFIDYFNTSSFSHFLESKKFVIYYSVVTQKELLSKKGLKEAEKEAILLALRQHRLIRINAKIAAVYSELRREYPGLGKEDALIAATALIKKIPLFTRNWKHFRHIKGLTLFSGE